VSVKQGFTLPPLLVFLYIDVGMIVEGVQGEGTRSRGCAGRSCTFSTRICMRVTHMLYTDDLTLLVNATGPLQTMLNRLAVYECS